MSARRITRVLVVLVAIAAIGFAAGSAWAYHQSCGLDSGTDVGTGSSGGDTYVCYSVGNPLTPTTPCGPETICGNVHAGPRATDAGTSGAAFDVCASPGPCVGRTGAQTAGLNGTTLAKTGLLVAGNPAGTTNRTGVEYVPTSPINGPPSVTCAVVTCVPSYVHAGTVNLYANSGTPVPVKLCVSWSTACP